MEKEPKKEFPKVLNFAFDSAKSCITTQNKELREVNEDVLKAALLNAFILGKLAATQRVQHLLSSTKVGEDQKG